MSESIDSVDLITASNLSWGVFNRSSRNFRHRFAQLGTRSMTGLHDGTVDRD